MSKYATDLRDMGDEEIAYEINKAMTVIEEEEPWLEALVTEQQKRRGSPEQQGVTDWALRCFGAEKSNDKKERAFRFLEEALELAQACDVSPEEIGVLQDYTYGRPVGEVDQEIAGTLVCLMLLASAYKIDALEALRTELDRVSTPEMMAKIRAKVMAAPDGPLPQ